MIKTPSSFYTIRFTDCDMFGHLNNARYLDYFLTAREEHLNDNYQLNLSAFYQQGIAWVVGNHEISYLRPSLYNEKVLIKSTLLRAKEDMLLVEMMMTNEQESHIKALLWTTFIPINLKTGKKGNHLPSFMDFAKNVENRETDISGGLKERLNFLKSNLKS